MGLGGGKHCSPASWKPACSHPDLRRQAAQEAVSGQKSAILISFRLTVTHSHLPQFLAVSGSGGVASLLCPWEDVPSFLGRENLSHAKTISHRVPVLSYFPHQVLSRAPHPAPHPHCSEKVEGPGALCHHQVRSLAPGFPYLEHLEDLPVHGLGPPLPVIQGVEGLHQDLGRGSPGA